MMYKDLEYYKPYLLRCFAGEPVKKVAEEAGCSASNIYKLMKDNPELRASVGLKPSRAETLYMDGAHGTFNSMCDALWEHRMTKDQAWSQMKDIVEMIYKHVKLFDKRRKLEKEMIKNGKGFKP